MPFRAVSSLLCSWQGGLFGAIGLWCAGVFAQSVQPSWDGPINYTALMLLAIALKGLFRTNGDMAKAFQKTLDRICDRWESHQNTMREEFRELRVELQQTRLHCAEQLARHDHATNGKE